MFFGCLHHQRACCILDDRLLSDFGQDGFATDRKAAMRQIPAALHIEVSQLKLGEYRGKGSYGIVTDGSYFGTRVAVKKIQIDPQNGDEAIDDVLHEVNLLHDLHHPSVLQLVGLAVAQDCSFAMIVTELCMMDMSGFIKDFPKCTGKHNFRSWHTVVLQICGGMAYLHEHGILHRDLKPRNVLLNCSPSGITATRDMQLQAKICDFGESVVVRRKDGSNDSGNDSELTVMPGTPVYMAPECHGDPESPKQQLTMYSNKVDVYSFGIMMWQVCFVG